MRPLTRLLAALVLICKDGTATGEFTPSGRAVHVDDGNFSKWDHARQETSQQQVVAPPPGTTFSLKVQVEDVLSHQYLSQAAVEVYANYTRVAMARTLEDGAVLLQVPYQNGLPVTLVASRDGYVCAVLPCSPSRMPVFSSLTMSLLGLTQGNIWLFEDSFLITDKTSDGSLQPVVQFPKSLLNLTDSGDITSFKAYLTVPRLSTEDDSFFGIMSSKSGYFSVELRPVAAVSVHLFSRDTELRISGPIKIRLSLSDNCGLQPSNVIPAWLYNQTTGGFMRQGLGTVVSEDGKLSWTFTAPHLGYWVAAPLSTSRGFFRLAIPTDLILHHSPYLMLLLGGVILIIILLLAGLSCYHRSSARETKVKRILPMTRKDRSTSTCDFETSPVDAFHSQDGPNQSQMEDNQLNCAASLYNANVIANPSVAIALDCTELDPNAGASMTGYNAADHSRVPASLTDSLLFYNQPVAILHASAFFQLEDQLEQPQWNRSATLPRVVASSSAGTTEPQSQNTFTQTLPKAPNATQSQAAETDDQLGVLEDSRATASAGTPRAQHGMAESASVPGTLNKIRDKRHSVRTLAELSNMPPSQPPRAWFVSLEGKPAAETHYAGSEQQRRRRAVDSRETSLDSGVDMSELNQTPGRRAVTLERNATFIKRTSSSKHSNLEENSKK